jgi:hypothetical protein
LKLIPAAMLNLLLPPAIWQGLAASFRDTQHHRRERIPKAN